MMPQIPFSSWLAPVPLIAILRGVRPREVVGIAQALQAAGLRIVEVPLNSPDPFESIRLLSACFGEALLIGAGTVRTPQEVDELARAGGRIVVMPHADAAVIARAKALGLYCTPGFFTPTEAFAALAAGADGLKLFPAEAASPGVLKALRAVLPPALPLLPVGGITAAGMAPWLAAGAAGFGLGSALYRPGQDAASVRANAEAFVAALRG